MTDAPMSYKAGAARTCITPDLPLWLAGYAARTAPAQGTISDLYASALALEDGTGGQLVIVSADLIAVTPTITEPIARIARERFGLAREQLLLTATHTHYAPEFRPDKATFFGIPDDFAAKIPQVADRLVDALIHVVGEAVARLEPARLIIRRTTAGFAHNRRRHGVVAGAPSTEDLINHDVPVLECVDARGNRKAIVFGYACHNTTIPFEDSRYCGDWAGFAKAQIEQSNPGTTALFIPGAGADQNPEPTGSIQLSRAHGRELADAVERAVAEPGVEIQGPIRIAWEDVSLPLRPVKQESLREALASGDRPRQVKARFIFEQLERGEQLITSYTAPVQVVRFGEELVLVALCGEPVVDWAEKLKRGAESGERGARHLNSHRSPMVWVAGYCNDMFGYLPTRRVQEEGGYEAGRANLWSWIPAPFTDDVEERITDAVERLLAQVGVGD